MKISLNDCVVIGESNKIFDIMLQFMKDIIKSCDGLEKIVLYRNEYYYLYDNTLDCTKIFIRDLKIVSNVLIIFCD